MPVRPTRDEQSLIFSGTVVLRCLGQQQLDKVRLSRSRCPRKQGPPFCAISGFRRPVESDPACQWLPLWGSWRAKARLRGQARHERTAHAAISRLFVSAMLSLRPQITVSILALSVTFGDSSPKGRGFGYSVRLRLFGKGSPSGGAGAKRLRGQARHERTAHAAISRLFVRAMLSLRPRITVSILALSVTCGDTARVAAPSVCFALARILLAAAPTATPCFRRWRRSSPLLPEGEALSEPERCAKNCKNPLANLPEMRYNTSRGKSAGNRISASLAQSVRAPDC